MKLILMILTFLPLAGLAFEARLCDELNDDCEFYTCIAEAKACKNNSYPTNFGRKYCLRFEDRMNHFSTDGQVWINEVKRCLINQMSQYDEKMTCSQLKRQAFRDHGPCYLESGFCQLSKEDRKELIKTVYPSLKHPRVLIGGYQLMKACNSK